MQETDDKQQINMIQMLDCTVYLQ